MLSAIRVKNDVSLSAFGIRCIQAMRWKILLMFLTLSIKDCFSDVAFRIVVDLLISYLMYRQLFTDTFLMKFSLLWNVCRVA
jgi:ABC-type iron transport system FetAB permease component